MIAWSLPRTLSALAALATATTVSAFKFNVTGSVYECAPVEFTWSGGSAPFSVTVITAIGAKYKQDIPSAEINTTTGGKSQWTMPHLPIDANHGATNVVFVMSDSTGFAAGGATKPYMVQARPSNMDCVLNNATAQFWFYVTPNDNALKQCSNVELDWIFKPNSTYIPEQPVTIAAVVSEGNTTQIQLYGASSASNYRVNVTQYSSIIFTAWDANGAEGGASHVFTVVPGSSSCMPGGGGLSTGAIIGIAVGSAVGGLFILGLAFWFGCAKRRRACFSRKGVRQGAVDMYDPAPATIQEPDMIVAPVQVSPYVSLTKANPVHMGGYDLAAASQPRSQDGWSYHGGMTRYGGDQSGADQFGAMSVSGSSSTGGPRRSSKAVSLLSHPEAITEIQVHEDGGRLPPARPPVIKEELPPVYNTAWVDEPETDAGPSFPAQAAAARRAAAAGDVKHAGGPWA